MRGPDSIARKLSRQYWLIASAGAVLIGVTLPCLLVIWRTEFLTKPAVLGLGVDDNGDPSTRFVLIIFIKQCLGLLFLTTILCGPGAIVLASYLYNELKKRSRDLNCSLPVLVRDGVFIGVLISFLNLPGYLSIFLLRNPGEQAFVRAALLFIVSGATCGMWIAWQAWRAAHPEERLLPRFSLKSLLIVVMAWGRCWPSSGRQNDGILLAFKEKQPPLRAAVFFQAD